MSNNFPTQSEVQIGGGVCRLGAVMHRSAASTVYETEFGEEALPAVVKVRRADMADSRWGDATGLVHPNLLRIYAAGHTVVEDVPVAYVVMERADESLAGVLRERPLSEQETREMLAPTLAALSYLHKNGYAHCNLKASNILAVGDSLKLSSEDVRRIGDGGMPAEDMRALGIVMVEALTQAPPKMDEDAGPYILREASQLFTDIVRHCLDSDPDRRWTADQVQARLDAPVAAPVRTPAAGHVEELFGKTKAASEDRYEAAPPKRTPKWVFVALALLVIAVVGLRIVRKDKVPGPAATAIPLVEHVAPAVSAPAPADVKPAVSSPPSVKPGRRAGGWAVIAAAYRFQSPAEKWSGEMARRWSNFKWSVLPQQTGKTYFLVVIGQNLSEEEAEKLRDRAVRSGLPRGTYIKKLE